jgi:hypothetical protein
MNDTRNQLGGPRLLAAALFVFAALPVAAFADGNDDFTNAGLAGRYAVTVTGKGGQSPTAGVGVVEFDAQGGVAGRLVFNLPDAQTGARTFADIPLTGSYLLHPDGTGKVILVGAAIKEAVFTVTRAERRFARSGPHLFAREKVAQELALFGKELGALQNNLLTATATRLSDSGGFTHASLAGRYALAVSAAGGQSPTAALGVVAKDAQGNLTGSLLFNLADPQTGERFVFEMPTSGDYVVNPDGTGKITFLGGAVKEAAFVITRAEQRFVRVGAHVFPREWVALEVALLAKEPGEGGHLLTGTATRLPE